MRLNGAIYWLAGDHLGSTSVVLNAVGNRVSEARHYPYGEERWRTSTLPTDYRFTGQRLSAELGLYQMGARWVDPSLALWLSPDSIVPDLSDPQSLNRFSYVTNQPLKYTDPSGHFLFLAWLGAGVVTAGAAAGIDLVKQLVVDQKDFADVNWAEVGGAAAGGLVAGLTLGLAPATAGVGTLLTLGAIGGGLVSQAQAITQAGLEEALGQIPQGSFIKEARDLGLLDPGTIALNAATGAIIGTLGTKVSGWLRTQLGVPSSAGTIRSGGEVSMVRYQLGLSGGRYTIQMEGRVIQADATTMEAILRAFQMGSYDWAAELIQQGLEQGVIEVVDEESQP